ncbi:hypothetical protein EVAR_40324_1 [Eumeta japonica]|uniref:Uncharacterized protein n=1 Tax=Eumeta variegata TaxID=151549 RepID=A0A4C1YBU8_EUMVA|nr:hypothetical protein EVAR_40324_1 [Eumeta japonica]
MLVTKVRNIKSRSQSCRKSLSRRLPATAAHTLIVSSRYANHTSDQVVKAIRDVVDAREVGVGVDMRKAGNQKSSCPRRCRVRIKISKARTYRYRTVKAAIIILDE